MYTNVKNVHLRTSIDVSTPVIPLFGKNGKPGQNGINLQNGINGNNGKNGTGQEIIPGVEKGSGMGTGIGNGPGTGVNNQNVPTQQIKFLYKVTSGACSMKSG